MDRFRSVTVAFQPWRTLEGLCKQDGIDLSGFEIYSAGVLHDQMVQVVHIVDRKDVFLRFPERDPLEVLPILTWEEFVGHFGKYLKKSS